MKSERISASAQIEAPAQTLYNIIADYHDGHKRILPKPPFVGLQVVEGGVGADTVILVEMKVFGRSQTLRGVITEPGRVLVGRTTTAS